MGVNFGVRPHRRIAVLHENRRLGIVDGGSAELRQTHFMRESITRNPLRTSHGRSLFQHLVDLLKGKTLCLGNDEVGEENAKEKSTAPDEEYLRFQVPVVLVNEVRCYDSDDTVPEPV